MILLSWLLLQHRIWRGCHIRVFTITDGVDAEKAKAAAKSLSKVLRARRLADIDVEVILADEDMLDPYTHDYTLRVEERHKFLAELNNKGSKAPTKSAPTETMPCEIEDLFSMEENGQTSGIGKRNVSDDGHIVVTDVRHVDLPTKERSEQSLPRRKRRNSLDRGARNGHQLARLETPQTSDGRLEMPESNYEGKAGLEEAAFAEPEDVDIAGCDSFNKIILSRSKRAQLVVMNLPSLWGTAVPEVTKFMTYCERLTDRLDRVLFVHSSGHEIFDIHR